MKKRILSLFLALVTVFYILPIGSIPAIALGESEETGIDIADMEVGKLYSAKWDMEFEDFVPQKPSAEDPDLLIWKDYGEVEMDDAYVLKADFPQELIVERVAEDDEFYLRVVNVNWPADYYDFRYIKAWDVIVLEQLECPTVSYYGEEIDQVTLFNDGKMPLEAVKPEWMASSDVEWGWEILIDAENNTWAKVADKTSKVCHITYALVKNILDENDQAKIRAVANDGRAEFKSEPVTINMAYVPKPIDDEKHENVTASQYVEHSAKSYAEGSSEYFLITVRFIKRLPNGQEIEVSKAYTRETTADYEAFPVSVDPVLGYYASDVVWTESEADGKVSTVVDADGDIIGITIAEGITSDVNITVYYDAGEAEYTIIHYIQNIYDDLYVEASTQIIKATVDTEIPDSHYTTNDPDSDFYNLDFVGFYHLYYEKPQVAVDGSTVVEIYYDREYFDVTFDLVQSEAYGQESLLVKYETEISVNTPLCTGYLFSEWIEVREVEVEKDTNGDGILEKVKEYEEIPDDECKYNEFTGNPHAVNPVITSSVIFLAKWTGDETSYSIVYWLENANDGNYSVWHTILVESTASAPVISGTYAKWDMEVHSEVKNDLPLYEYVSLNYELTDTDPESEGVIIHGDGSSTVNIYFNRRVYNIDFHATPIETLTHDHANTTTPCKFNTMYCTDPINHTTHKHTDDCGEIVCEQVEHKHNADCCDTHVHQMSCYSKASVLSSDNDKVGDFVYDALEEQYGGIIAILGSWLLGSYLRNAVTSATNELATAAPPKNLQNGYITNHAMSLGSYSATVPLIYLNGDWYLYSATEGEVCNDGDIKRVDNCDYPDHDHTSGCTYGEKCTMSEHVHINSCYASCSDTTIQHEASCYGNVCSIPTYTEVKDGEGNVTDTYTSIKLQAKFGQDITELLPYYLELYPYGLHKDGTANFTGWKYAGTGWADDGTTRYVKHVTMVDALCYSEGVTATAQYDENATNAYVLYYLFESFDTTSATKDYAIDGSARQQFGGKWYDSDPKHIQLVMSTLAPDSDSNGVVDVVIDTDKKEIEGFNFVTADGNPALGTLDFTIGTTKSETLNAYFYDREEVVVKIHNAGKEVPRIPEGTEANLVVRFGAPFKDLAAALKASDLYGNFDVTDVPYPSTLEAGAYTFADWYTTPYKSKATEVDWDNDTVPAGELNLYAIWDPLTRVVNIYEDSNKDLLFSDGRGHQETPHRTTIYEPDVEKATRYTKADGYTFAGWYYIDPETGTEKRFRFTFKITADIDIYAKWDSEKIVPYKINYLTPKLDSTGNEIEGEYVQIADSLERTAVAGQSRTFSPLVGTALYEKYQKGYFPTIGSHTVQMVANKIGEDAQGDPIYETNEYSFIYKRTGSVNYTVRYLEMLTDQVLLEEKKAFTDYAAVTEEFLPVSGYTVDKYAKTVVISLPDVPEMDEDGNITNAENVITFYYTKDEEGETPSAPIVINHYIQNYDPNNPDDNTYSLHRTSSSEGYVDGTTYYYGSVLTDISGYTFSNCKITSRQYVDGELWDYEITEVDSQTVDGVQQYGAKLTEFGIEINLYYNRDKVGYRVQYRDHKDRVLVIGSQRFEDIVSAENSEYIHGMILTVALNNAWDELLMQNGYQLVDPDVTEISKQLYIDSNQNIIVFYYKKMETEYVYEIVCDDLVNSGVGLSLDRETINANGIGEDDEGNEVEVTPKGSTPIESTTYYFAGWYLDAECTTPVNPTTDNVTIEETYKHLTPLKRNGILYYSETYYAKFLPRAANVQITVNTKQSDSFILTFTGTAGTALGQTFTVVVHDGVPQIIGNVKIGTYTVAVNGDWSWRYGADSLTKEITVSTAKSGVLEIYNTFELSLEVVDSSTTPTVSNKDKWLTDDASGTVTPTVTP